MMTKSRESTNAAVSEKSTNSFESWCIWLSLEIVVCLDHSFPFTWKHLYRYFYHVIDITVIYTAIAKPAIAIVLLLANFYRACR